MPLVEDEQTSGLAYALIVRRPWLSVPACGRYRLEDAADLAWRPADAVLGSRLLSNLFVAGPVIVMLVAIVRHDGRFGLVADIQDPAALGAFLYGMIRTGRWWRESSRRSPRPGAPESNRRKRNYAFAAGGVAGELISSSFAPRLASRCCCSMCRNW
jgi:hypothetical protein